MDGTSTWLLDCFPAFFIYSYHILETISRLKVSTKVIKIGVHLIAMNQYQTFRLVSVKHFRNVDIIDPDRCKFSDRESIGIIARLKTTQ